LCKTEDGCSICTWGALTANAEQHSFVKLRDSISAKLSRSQLSAINKQCRQWMDAFETRKGAK